MFVLRVIAVDAKVFEGCTGQQKVRVRILKSTYNNEVIRLHSTMTCKLNTSTSDVLLGVRAEPEALKKKRTSRLYQFREYICAFLLSHSRRN